MQLPQLGTFSAFLVVALISGCDRAVQRDTKETAFRIVATDAGFEAPDAVAVGLRHIIYENHGSKVHEAMLVKLPAAMSAADFQSQVRRHILFPKGILDYSGPGLMSPGETVDYWLRVDPGEYVLICWNHLRSEPVHSFSVRSPILEDAPPRADVVLK